MIYIENEQGKLTVTEEIEELINTVIEASLKHEKIEETAEVNVLIVDNEAIRQINNEQRNIDSATDVLSFPMLDFENGKMIKTDADYFEGDLVLGDIVVSFERAKEQSEEFGHSFNREVGFLVCHSMLHLLGYDHMEESERQIMRQKEEAILESINLTR
jgi:probable rRNA maturation factor